MISGAGTPLIPNPVFEATTLALQGERSPLQPGQTNVTRETAEDFESFFLSQMFAELFRGVETDPVFGGGPGETVFKSMMVDEYAKSVTRAGGVGIADAVMREMLSLQEDN